MTCPNNPTYTIPRAERANMTTRPFLILDLTLHTILQYLNACPSLLANQSNWCWKPLPAPYINVTKRNNT